MFTPGPSEIPTMGMSTVTAYVHFVFEDTSRVGCGLGLPCLAYSQNGTMLSNRDDFRHFAPPDRPRVTSRSAHDETTETLWYWLGICGATLDGARRRMLNPPSCFRCSLGRTLGRTCHGRGREVHWRLIHWGVGELTTYSAKNRTQSRGTCNPKKPTPIQCVCHRTQ